MMLKLAASSTSRTFFAIDFYTVSGSVFLAIITQNIYKKKTKAKFNILFFLQQIDNYMVIQIAKIASF